MLAQAPLHSEPWSPHHRPPPSFVIGGRENWWKISRSSTEINGGHYLPPSPLSLTYNLNNMLYKIVKWQAFISKSTKNSRAFKSIGKKKTSLCSCWESAMPTCKCWASPVGERKRNPPNLTKYFPIPMATASLGSGLPETLSKACVTWKTWSVSSCHKQHTGWGIRVLFQQGELLQKEFQQSLN